jgi:hypothetical protein
LEFVEFCGERPRYDLRRILWTQINEGSYPLI